MQSRLQRMCAGPVQAQMMMNTRYLTAMPSRNFGASEKQLMMRLKSVTNIRKITKAMKLVAASKMKGDLNRLNAGKKFGNQAIDMMLKNDLYMQRRAPEMPSAPRTLLVPITSDKGLCGGVNSQLLRQLREWVSHEDRSKLSLFACGDKGSGGLLRPLPDMVKQSISHC